MLRYKGRLLLIIRIALGIRGNVLRFAGGSGMLEMQKQNDEKLSVNQLPINDPSICPSLREKGKKKTSDREELDKGCLVVDSR